jgi:Flp pilus assembly protein TadG
MRLLTRRRPDERGAIAVVFAFCCVMFFVLAAMGVDLGNAMNRKKQVQSQADFSALAAGGALPVSGTPQATDSAVKAAMDYLNRDQPADDAKTCDSSKTCVTAVQLVNGQLADGEVTYLGTDMLKVTAPTARINFSLAQVLGKQSVDVSAAATVRIFTPGTGVMPTYAVTGCDWGVQTLTDPSNGQVNPIVPPLEDSPGDGDADLTSLSPTSVALNAANQFLTINGAKLDGKDAAATVVGFFRSTASTSGPTKVAPVVPVTPPSGTSLQVVIPTTVTAVEDIWWVRVRTRDQQGADHWSPAAEALPLRIGEAVLECVGASNEGNFGTILLPRTDIANNNNNLWLAANMAVGLQAPLSMHTYDGSAPANGECAPGPSNTNSAYIQGPGDNQTRYAPSGSAGSPSDLVERTNCVDTDGGLPANATTAGMIVGLGNAVAPKGRLRDKPTTCGPGGNPGTQSRTATINGQSYTFNNDILTCFFTNGSAHVSDVSVPNYTFNGGNPVISADIYSSPRFFYVPVLKVKPATGGSKHYFIIDFRPAFLTGNPSTATKQAPGVTPSDDNGIQILQNDIKSMKVVFINRNAIETPDGGPVGAYLGVGTKLVRLIN